MSKKTLAAKIALRIAAGAARSAETRHYESPAFRKKMKKKHAKQADCTPCAAMDYVDQTFASLGEL